MQKKILFSLLTGLLLASVAMAQPPATDKTELERERQELQRELKEMQGMYDKVKGQSKQALGQLSVLNRKIVLQERYINSISKELKMIDDDLYLSNLEIYRLQRQLDTLKLEYAKSLVYAYKNRSSYDYLNFIFSASSFNDAIKRISYLKSYRKYRENQAKTILDTQEEIAKRQKQQLSRKEQKNVALQSQTKEKTVLDVQKKEKDVVLGKLKSQEKDLQKQINAKKKRDNELKNAIAAIIRRIQKEADDKARADAEARKKTEKPDVVVSPNPESPRKETPRVVEPKKYYEYNAADIKLGADFTANKGRLPWPVDQGAVSIHFGRYKIEGTLIQGDNPGITIATQAGNTVKAVFEGQVAAVFNIGDGMAVMIKHGKYSTIYSNLTSVSVKKDDMLRTGQSIGKAGRNDEGTEGQIDFILMIEKNNVNPEPWLRR